ncbi:MAG: hypothetical protein M3Z41_04335 [Candidatus Eremiobacteraeota bacterium]|nr:hypothetical protein [Candidatus Eremiobacteraeota bacterium]
MQIERVDVTPRQDVYNPGEVIDIAIYFRSPFNGQCRVGLVPKGHPSGEDFERKTFAKSTATLYEGQLYIKDSNIGTCVLRATLAPVSGEPRTVAVGAFIFEVRPLVPTKH